MNYKDLEGKTSIEIAIWAYAKGHQSAIEAIGRILEKAPSEEEITKFVTDSLKRSKDEKPT